MFKEGKDMKKLRTMLVMLLTLTMMFTAAVAVNADTTTDLKSMTVYAVDAAGNKTEVPMEFNSTTYTYDLTVMSNTVSISIEAAPADTASTWSIEKDGINTKMDFGKNLTVVAVKSTSGIINKYTLNTTKLTETEEATCKAPDVSADNNDNKTAQNAGDKNVKVGKKEMKISSSFDKNLIPEGFKKAKAEYDGKNYACIKGEVKDLTAFYLYSDDTEGFYIYDAEKNEFYVMNNIQIKSRMYTIVNPEQTDGLLKNYDKKTVTIIDREVKAWVLDEEEGMYLVYAMNWNGDISLYCYDDNEKCFQRYIISADANTQAEAANTAYENLQKKYNNLVDKYNALLKILCGLAIVIIVLIFVIINITIAKKEKKVKAEKKTKKGKADKTEINTQNVISEDMPKVKNEYTEEKTDISDNIEKPEALQEEIEIPEIILDDIEEPVQKTEDSEENGAAETQDSVEEDIENEEKEESSKRKLFGRKKVSDRTYGDEPTLGSEAQSDKGFYGGELDDEDEILIDITDEEPETETADKEEKTIKAVQQETEEDLKETLKSMLPDEQDDEDDDDDFEFIDLN